MKVIFLDIDGVLLPFLKNAVKPAGCFPYHAVIPSNTIQNLQKIVDQTGAKIVISSSWANKLPPVSLFTVLATHGFNGPYVLPQDLEKPVEEHIEFNDWSESDSLKFYGTTITPRLLKSSKIHEIGLWLAEFKHLVTRFVVLDDKYIEPYSSTQVKPDSHVGLTEAEALLAIHILNS